jgi:uncharacterized protein
VLDNNDIILQYMELMREVDAVVRHLEGLHRAHLRCRPGCCACCTLSSVLALEAAALEMAIARLDEKVKKLVRDQRHGEFCPLLVDSLCAVYQGRPLICRTHGLPIAYVDYERQAIDVSVCPLNFAADYEFVRQELLFIDTFNVKLARFNREYCKRQEITNTGRIAMADIVAAATAEPAA